jgi:tRNA-Thr(GGU) m(6)t(6)A37 methyltransferase TsaA
MSYPLVPVAVVRSSLTDRHEAPRQGDEGAPDAWIEVNEALLEAAADIVAGDELILITWFHEAQRDVLKVHPRDNPSTPLTGVFSTRSPDRPNPLGLHRVRVLAVEPPRLRVAPLEAIDGTPIVDIKPVLSRSEDA